MANLRRNRRPKPSALPIGEFSSGTLRPEDVVPALLDLASAVRLSRADRFAVRRLGAEFAAWEDRPDRFPDFDPIEVWDELDLLLGNYAPDYARFGSLEGDGACLGVWPLVDEAAEEARRFARGRGSEVAPSREAAEAAWRNREADRPWLALEVNDHGNATLFRRIGPGRWREVWSVV